MSLLASASLILTPNGYKSGKLYSIVPSSGNGDLTFTRATSASRTNSSGLIENILAGVPRLDYSGSISSILLEPQRTNLQLQSSNFTTSWTLNSSATVTSNSTISPDGTQNADTINPATSISSGVYQFVTVSSGAKYTFSVYIKNISTATSITIGCDTNPSTALLDYNPTTKTITTNGAGIISSSVVNAGNDWYRVSGNYTSTGTANDLVIYSQDSSGIPFAVWGAQLESGSYATSYIPTTTSTVTRNLDDISKTGVSTDILNPSEGTFYVEISALANDLTARILSINDGTDYNNIQIQFSSVSNVIRLDTYGQTGVGTTTNYRSSVTVSDTTTFHKCLIKWGAGGIFGYVDGVKYTLGYAAGTIGGSGIPTALNRIDFRQYWGGNPFYGKCKGMQIYETALTDAECASLTTL